MKTAVLVAGGTGGHINAALAVGEALQADGWNLQYLTGKRPLDYKLFQGQNVRHLDSKPLRTNNPIQLAKNIWMNLSSFLTILISFKKNRPSLIVGAGGYVCGPTLLAGFLLGVPVFIIEQNAVMGLTNKILGWFSTKIFVHFTKTKGLSASLAKKVRVVGNPTRKSIQPPAQKTFDGDLKVLVFGGSLGAAQINKIIFSILENPKISKLSIHHQLGSDVKVPDIKSSVNYTPMNYIDNMQKEYEWCDVIISRAGASTVSELAIIKKPVILIPYPAATDNHQVLNAEIFREEADYTVEILSPNLSHEKSVELVQEFLHKASVQEIKYSKNPSTGNHSCDEILKEIKSHVRLA
jgi:UDP-N-acetylglucosamine--N-acetylmuramyl-(pentapeptide) pyrophosphoryl-undecaprenol N-acetylglucosamine transferase